MIDGLDKLFAQLEKIADLDLVSAEIDAVNVFAEEARNLVPVDTGALQITIGVEVEGDTVNLVAGNEDVNYALYVEMGTIKMAAQPYMRPAVDNKQKQAMKAAAENINAQMKRIAGNG
jgi:HK97 gp10 family phage protein